MKRGKAKPPQSVVDDAIVIADILAVGRRSEISEALIVDMVKLAMSEYMRVYKARKQNEDPWVEMPLLETRSENRSGGSGYPKGGVEWTYQYTQTFSSGETDFQCFFCRKSLNTLSCNRVASKEFRKNLRINHIDECAIRFLAGIGDPHPPLAHGKPGR
jgi:hypothetical protein